MQVIDPGHTYKLDFYDTDPSDTLEDRMDHYLMRTLVFVKRSGPKHPNNTSSYPGTNCQEVLRALIDRVLFLDNQVQCWHNKFIIFGLRLALYMFELRNAQIKGLKWPLPWKLNQEVGPDGHFK